MLAEAPAAELDTPYRLYFPDAAGRVTAAAVVGCVCLDNLTCTECERILGDSVLAIELAARKNQRTAPLAPLARVDIRAGQGLGPGLHGVEGSDAAISGMEDRLGPGSHGVVEGFEAAISGMAARLGLAAAVGERAKEVFRKMEEARAWHHGRGWTKVRSKGPLAYAACLSIACRAEGSALSLRELARAAAADGGAASRKDIAMLIAHIRRRLGEEATGIGMVCVSSYLRRFSALVGLRGAEEAAALEAARRLEEGVLDVRHNPDSMAAAVVCLVLERASDAREPVKDVATASGITYDTIYRVCRSLRPHAELLFG